GGILVTHHAPDAVPEPVVTASYHHVAVLTGVHGVNVDGQVPVAVARTDAAVHRIPRPTVIEDAYDGLGRRSFDELTFAGNVIAIHQSSQNAHGRCTPAHVIGHPQRGACRVSSELLGIAGAVDNPAGGLGHWVQHSWLVLGRAPLSALANPAIDQPRIDLF